MQALLSAPYGTPLPPELAGVSPGAPSAAIQPKECREAIASGIAALKAGDTAAALALFQDALRLPGTGVLRDRAKPRERTSGEEAAAYYNIACAQARLGAVEEGLAALRSCFSTGYSDFKQVQTDADLAPLRASPGYAALMRSYDRPSGGAPGRARARAAGRAVIAASHCDCS